MTCLTVQPWTMLTHKDSCSDDDATTLSIRKWRDHDVGPIFHPLLHFQTPPFCRKSSKQKMAWKLGRSCLAAKRDSFNLHYQEARAEKNRSVLRLVVGDKATATKMRTVFFLSFFLPRKQVRRSNQSALLTFCACTWKHIRPSLRFERGKNACIPFSQHFYCRVKHC